MTVFGITGRAALTVAALVLFGACETAGASAATMPAADCFSSIQWQGWRSPSDDVLYLRVRNHDVYRLDLVPGSGRLDNGDRFLISEVRGSNRVCTANDLDLSIASANGFRTPLFPRAIRKLTAEEVAALPARDRP